ncbi:MAG: c-type cytochrome [Gemmatimonadetes bacterium]|nr:c-type cytochrome [Gemmatimonadota bacterium]MBP9106122.1 c-type cytochrome [Gemmatimonadaceae bacterium]
MSPPLDRDIPNERDTPQEREWLERSLDRWYLAGIGCIVLLLAAFPVYAWREPRRLAAAREERQLAYIEMGEKTFAMHCASCHGDNGGGGRTASTLRSREYLQQATVQQVEWAIAGGRTGTAMAAWSQDFGGPLTMEEVRQLSEFIKSYDSVAVSVPEWKKGVAAPPPAERPVVAKWRERRARERVRAREGRRGGGPGAPPPGAPPLRTEAPTIAKGQTLWGSYCASCHVPVPGMAKGLAPLLISREYLQFATDERVDSIITVGVPGTTMLGWGKGSAGMLDATQIRSLILFLRAQQATAPSDPTWKEGRKIPIP